MGNESSQLQRSEDRPSHASRTFGPSMSPTPEPDDDEERKTRGPAASPLAHDVEPIQDGLPTAKKKRKKRKKGLDSNAAAPEAGTAGQEDVEALQSRNKSMNKKSKRKELQLKQEEEAVVDNTQPEPQIAESVEPPRSPQRKKKRSKERARVDELPLQNILQQEHLLDGDSLHEDPEAVLENGTHDGDAPLGALPGEGLGSLNPDNKNNKTRRNKRDNGPSSEPEQVFVAFADGGTPPSAQPPRTNHIFNHEPPGENDEEEGEEGLRIIPFSQGQSPRRQSTQPTDHSQLESEPSDSESDTSLLDPSQLKREPLESEHESEELLQSQFAGIAAANFAEALTDPVARAMREQDLDNGLGWLHKRDNASQETLTRTEKQRSVDARLPDLLPSQVKTEPEVDGDSDKISDSTESSMCSTNPGSNSPSAQRSERLSISRSRSASRVPADPGYLADQALGVFENSRPEPYAEVPYSAPSSTGSDRSIPARLPSPSTTGSNRSIPAHNGPKPSPSRSRSGKTPRSTHAMTKNALEEGDVVAEDSRMVRDPSPPKQRGKKSAPPQKDVTVEPEPVEASVISGGPVLIPDVGEVARTRASPNGDAMDIDKPLVQESQMPEVKRATGAPLSRKRKALQSPQPAEIDTASDDREAVVVGTGSQAAKSTKRNRKSRGGNDMADSNVHVMANWLGGSVAEAQQSQAEDPAQNGALDDELPLDDMPDNEEMQPTEPVIKPRRAQRRKPKASLATEGAPPLPREEVVTAPGPLVESGVAVTSQRKKGKGKASRDTARATNPGTEAQAEGEDQDVDPEAAAAAVDNVEAQRDATTEPEGSASHPQPTLKPKGKRKRMLTQTKVPLSLSQMEVDDEDDFSMVFSRRKSTKQPAAGGSNEPDPNQPGPSQVASPERPRKIKRRKRGADKASEDEMESILAAGPSRGRKRPGARDLSGNEDGRGSKKKRLATADSGKASGAWGQDELDALGRVVEVFLDEYGLEQEELNNLIHEVPNKADRVNKDFWDRADMAVPRRTRKQVTERARRIYHNFVARGTWTDEQKAEVHSLFKEYPNKWRVIANMINRHQQDVRDYWRNHYLVHEAQVKSRWSQDEEDRLKEVVQEAISKIRIAREDNDQFRPRPRAKKSNDEAMLDWQQISAAMDLTRSRQQCKWKWTDMRERGLVGDATIRLPTQPRRSGGPSSNGLSDELANAREDYRGMGPEEKFRLIDSIKDCGAREDKNIPWRSLVDEDFRLKWYRPALRLVWYRMRKTCPNYETQDVEANARFLVNYYHMHRRLPPFDDASANDEAEELVVKYTRGRKIWKGLSRDLRAIRERQRRSSSAASSRASSRPSRRVSSEILNLSGDDKDDEDEEDEEAHLLPRSRESTELGEEREDSGRPARPRPSRAAAALGSDELEVSIPGHLKGEAAKKALEQARAKTKSKGKGKAKAINLDGAAKTARGARSNSVAVDSESEG